MGHPGRVIPNRGLLVVAQVGHVARFGQPRPARSSVVLDLVAGPDAGAGYRVAPGVPGLHSLDHGLRPAKNSGLNAGADIQQRQK